MAKILVIEDNKEMQEIIKQVLINADYEVETADDGLAGFFRAADEQFDFITCDLCMPTLQGEEIISLLDLLGNNKVIIISGKLDDEVVEELSEHPCVVGILNEPFDWDKLLELVTENI